MGQLHHAKLPIRLFSLEKAFYETSHALGNRPRWAHSSPGCVAHLLEEQA